MSAFFTWFLAVSCAFATGVGIVAAFGLLTVFADDIESFIRKWVGFIKGVFRGKGN